MNLTREIVPNDPPPIMCASDCEWCDRNPFVAHPVKVRPLFLTTSCPTAPHVHLNKSGYNHNSICYLRGSQHSNLVYEMGSI